MMRLTNNAIGLRCLRQWTACCALVLALASSLLAQADPKVEAGRKAEVKVFRAVEAAIDDADAKARAAKEAAAKEAAEAEKAAAEAKAKAIADQGGAPAQATASPVVINSKADDLAAAYERALKEAKIDPSPEGLREYLMALHPGPDTRKQLDALIDELGAEEFKSREEAMSKLRQRSAIAMENLQAATEHADPEIRWRVKKLLENAATDADATLFNICKTIEYRRHQGLTAPLLIALPLCQKDHVRFAARKALATTALPEDAARLREQLKNTDPYVRIACLGALAAVAQKEAVDDALALINDREDRVRISAARLLAQAGKRESLPVLVALLDAREIEIRGEASRTLKAITGQDFGFVAYDAQEQRDAGRDKWKAWLAGDGQTAKLLLPLKDTPFELGRILVASYGMGKVMEFDVDAKDVNKPRWEVAAGNQPWAVQGLPTGNRLVALYGERKVKEFGAETNATKPIWESELLPGGPMGIHRLDDGRTVVACTDAETVVELTAEGKIDKKWSIPGRPVDARRLDSGTTLVTLQSGQKVIEIDRDGKTVWSTKISAVNPFSAQRLENGNTLIACLSGGPSGTGVVIEVNPAGDKEEWQLGGVINPYNAQRLPNGNTLVVDQSGVREFETKSKVQVWKLQLPNISRAARF